MCKVLLVIFLASLFSIPLWAQTGNLFVTATISTSGTTCATATSCVAYNVPGSQIGQYGTAAITVSGTYSGTLQVEANADGVNSGSLGVAPLAGGSTVTSITTDGIWLATNVSPLTMIRVRASALASGTPTVTISVGK